MIMRDWPDAGRVGTCRDGAPFALQAAGASSIPPQHRSSPFSCASELAVAASLSGLAARAAFGASACAPLATTSVAVAAGLVAGQAPVLV